MAQNSQPVQAMALLYYTTSPRMVKQQEPLKCNSFLLYWCSGESPLWSLCWAHPRFGTVLAVCTFNGEVSIWKEFKTGDWGKIAQHTGHTGSVNSIAWAPEEQGMKLASCSSDGKVIIYARNPKNDTFQVESSWIAHETGVNAISWAYDNALMLATGSADKTIKIWEQQFQNQGSYEEKLKLEGHKEPVRDVQWHPQGGFLASCSEDGLVIIWKIIEEDNFLKAVISQEIPFNFNVWRLSWQPIIGKQLAISGSYGGETFIKILEQDETEKFNLADDLDVDEQAQGQ